MKGHVCISALAAVTLAALSTSCDSNDRPRQNQLPPGSKEARMEPTAVKRKPNRLINEKSPYLLQHAHNPVNWYPWGKEAFRRARTEDKPIFLSVGYSTCHWCHVMERESFEHEDVARLLNRHFVAIKVDREERPDVDEIYMVATQLMTGQGGWPNSLWLTPEGKPWYAGTYFPREYRFGRPGFKTILKRLAKLWETRRKDLDQQAEEFSQAIRQALTARAGGAGVKPTRQAAREAVKTLRGTFDKRDGGFGGEPKFPPHGALRLLLDQYRRSRDDSLLEMATRTLDAMANGGIHDHVGGGFHRYATDRQWLVPHFEKMLYDNSQLARIYVDAHALTGRPRYREVAEGIFEWVQREMTHPDGGFYSAVDADSEGAEGRFYLWSHEEILETLGAEAGELFCRAYNVRKDGNFHDEASGGKPGTNILHPARPVELIAKVEGMDATILDDRLKAGRAILLERRNRRVRPHLDDKVLTSWNGLMIAALAHAGRTLNQPRYTRAAEKAANFILTEMRRGGRLLRTWRAGRANLNAYLDDYAFLAEALLELHEATAGGDRPRPGRHRWLDEAAALMAVLEKHYRHPSGGFFFTPDDHEDLLARSRSPFDQAMPAGNAVAASVLVRLGRLTGRRHYLHEAGSCLGASWELVRRTPHGATGMILAAGAYLDEAASSGTAESERARSQDGPVTVEAVASVRQAAPGETIRVTVGVTVDEGWHVYSHQPLQEHLPPTSVALGGGTPATLGKVSYPPGKQVRLGGNDEPISVYEGTVELQVPVTLADDAPPGPGMLLLRLRTQPCDDRRCLAPQTHELAVPIEVTGRAGSQ